MARVTVEELAAHIAVLQRSHEEACREIMRLRTLVDEGGFKGAAEMLRKVDARNHQSLIDIGGAERDAEQALEIALKVERLMGFPPSAVAPSRRHTGL